MDPPASILDEPANPGESPVPHLVRSNAVPRPADVHTIHETLADAHATINRLDAAIALLTRRRAAFAEYARGHTAILSPLRRLPAELLVEIFCYCVPDRPSACIPAFASTSFPMPLLHTCSFWRAVAISTPRLWTVICLDLAAALPRSLWALDTWARRAGSFDLTVDLRGSETTVLPPELLDALVQTSGRWEALRFHVWQPVSPILDRMDTGHLRTLDVRRLDGEAGYEVMAFINGCPTLRAAALPGWAVFGATRMTSTTVTHFMADDLCAHDFQIALELLPWLTHCVLGYAPSADTPPEEWSGIGHPRVPHTNLQVLKILVEDDERWKDQRDMFIDNVFHVCRFPGLRDLTLSCAHPPLHSALASFLQTAASILRFRAKCTFKSDHIVEYLPCMRSLQHLELSGVTDDDTSRLVQHLSLEGDDRHDPDSSRRARGLDLPDLEYAVIGKGDYEYFWHA